MTSNSFSDYTTSFSDAVSKKKSRESSTKRSRFDTQNQTAKQKQVLRFIEIEKARIENERAQLKLNKTKLEQNERRLTHEIKKKKFEQSKN